MEYPRTSHDVDALMGDLNTLVKDITEAKQKVVALTAAATELGGYVSVAVNARGVVVETQIDPRALESISAQRLAAAVTTAAQRAAEEVNAKAAEIWAPINDRRNDLPRADDALEGMPNLDDLFATPEPSLAPPGRDSRETSQPEEEYEALESKPRGVGDEEFFEDVEVRKEPPRFSGGSW